MYPLICILVCMHDYSLVSISVLDANVIVKSTRKYPSSHIDCPTNMGMVATIGSTLEINDRTYSNSMWKR